MPERMDEEDPAPSGGGADWPGTEGKLHVAQETVIPDEVVNPVGEDFNPQDIIEQLMAGAGVPEEEPEPAEVSRYWLDESSFRAVALLTQGPEAAIIVSDGENNIVLFDSVGGSIDGLYALEAIIEEAITSIVEATEGGTSDA